MGDPARLPLYLGADLLTQGGDTGMRAHAGETWPVPADPSTSKFAGDYNVPLHSDKATLRRVGWLDQAGRVWLRIPPAQVADRYHSGSFTPLLIDVRGD